ncbi:hypothetical protein ACFSLT_12700 [Novosphingobium resinovorum]
MAASSFTDWPGLAILVSPENTRPASTSACARVRLSASPRSTNSWSTRTLAGFLSGERGRGVSVMGWYALEMGGASFHTTGMKANPRSRATPLSALLLTGLAATAALSGCVPPPPSTPAPRPGTTHAPQPRPATPTAPPPSPMAADWRDAPQTPGNWSYAGNGAASGATFGNGQFIVQCDTARTVTLLRAAAPGQERWACRSPVPLAHAR